MNMIFEEQAGYLQKKHYLCTHIKELVYSQYDTL